MKFNVDKRDQTVSCLCASLWAVLYKLVSALAQGWPRQLQLVDTEEKYVRLKKMEKILK